MQTKIRTQVIAKDGQLFVTARINDTMMVFPWNSENSPMNNHREAAERFLKHFDIEAKLVVVDGGPGNVFNSESEETSRSDQ